MSKRLENLNNIVAVLRGGAKSYRSAARSVSHSALQDVFLQHADLREDFAGQLARVIHDAGAEPASSSTSEQTSTVAAKVGAALMATSEDEMLVNRLEEHEDRTLEAYRTALHHPDNAPDEAMLQDQFDKMKDGHDRMRALKQAEDPKAEAAGQV